MNRHLRDGPGDSGLRAVLLGGKHNVDPEDTMDDIVEHDSVPDVIAIARSRELLGDEVLALSDEEVDAIRRHAETMAHILVEMYVEHHEISL